MINGLFDSGAMPVLERMLYFTSERQKLIAHNIANIETPYFKPIDMDPRAFQDQLGEAMDRRRKQINPQRAPLEMRSTQQVGIGRDGSMQFNPMAINENILYHDENNRDLDRIMQDLVENTLAHRTAIDLLKNQFEMLEVAIREQV